jgi:hypothetical protein
VPATAAEVDPVPPAGAEEVAGVMEGEVVADVV